MVAVAVRLVEPWPVPAAVVVVVAVRLAVLLADMLPAAVMVAVTARLAAPWAPPVAVVVAVTVSDESPAKSLTGGGGNGIWGSGQGPPNL
jgi:hypothetical protein